MRLNHDSCVKRRATRLLLTLASSVPIWTCCISAPAVAETLSQALNATYKTNPRLDAERARLRATDEEVSRANGGYLPTILGSADVGYQNPGTKPASPTDGEAHPKGYALTITQPIFQGFRTLNSVREAEATVR